MNNDPNNARRSGAGAASVEERASEWRSRLACLTIGWLAFETLSGLSIYLLPFSVPNQWMVIVHTAVGLLVLIPALLYQARHLAVNWSRPFTTVKAMGYLAAIATLIAIISGLVLTVQAVFATRISYAWDMVHIVSTFALIAFTAPHLLVILFRDRSLAPRPEVSSLRRAQRRALVLASSGCVAALAMVAVLWALVPGPALVNAFPEDYAYPYGEDRPFAPSLARTASGGAYDARSLSGSESCGTAGCHEEIVAEWRVSAHRWAAKDLGFQRVQSEMAKQNGPESTRYCGGCHDPISLFSGSKRLFNEGDLTSTAGFEEGVSCLVCHSVRTTDLEGNANYTVAQPERYLFEIDEGRPARFARDFLIRAYPRHHTESLGKRLFKTPEYCAACHKQFIDQEVNNVGWVQLQNQYDNWRKSRWNHPGDPKKTIECRECHMPLTASRDPASGDEADYNRSAEDGHHRSHRFLGANQVMPALLELPGADEQIRLTEKWLRGEVEIPEIADKWSRGPAVALELVAPEAVVPGDPIALRAVVTSNKVGHDFPTGPLDIIQSWVEIVARDAEGNVVFTSGTLDDRHFIETGSFMFKAEPVDQYGNLIDRHNLWEMVGVRYRRSLFPGFSDTAEYVFRCPGGAGEAEQPPTNSREFTFAAPGAPNSDLQVTARLLYRKIDQYLLNFMFGESSGLTTPVTEMARDEATIRIVARSASRSVQQERSPGVAGSAARMAP